MLHVDFLYGISSFTQVQESFSYPEKSEVVRIGAGVWLLLWCNYFKMAICLMSHISVDHIKECAFTFQNKRH